MGDGQGARGQWRTDMYNPGADGTHRYEPTSIFEIVPADGHFGCHWRKRRLRYVLVFGQLFGQANCLPVYDNNGYAGDKGQ